MITNFWRWLFGGCEHKWAVLDKCIVYPADAVRDGVTMPRGTLYELQCEKCGDIKRRKIVA